MNLTPQKPPEPNPYGPGQCIDCGAAVVAPIVRCKRCAEKRASTACREIAVDEILSDGGPPLAKERFAYSLQELFGVMTLIAVILAAFVITPIAGILACLLLLPAATRTHRLLRVAETLNAKLDFSAKLSFYFRVMFDNLLVGVVGLGFIVLDAGFVVVCWKLLFMGITSFPGTRGDILYALWLIIFFVLCVLAIIVALALAGWFTVKMNKYFDWRWKRDMKRIIFLAKEQTGPNSEQVIKPTSPFDALDFSGEENNVE